MKKIFTLMALALMVFTGASSALAATYTVDNDNANPEDGINSRYGFNNYVSASSSYNDDHRTSNATADYYTWMPPAYPNNVTVSYYAYLNSSSFTNPSADYYIGDTDFLDMQQINQNTAPAGWNYIGGVVQNSSDSDQLRMELDGYTGYTTGADAVQFNY